MRDNFTPAVVRKVAERAAYICSNPSCRRLTIGPSTTNHTLSAKTGVAAHICGASPGGPRYDMSQSVPERRGIGNAIWLCATCSVLIDKNNGADYEASDLRKWKRDHEALVSQCLEGEKRLMFSFMVTPGGAQLAKAIVRHLEDHGALFQPYTIETPDFVWESLSGLRKSLVGFRLEAPEGSDVDIIAESMIRACRHYMNTTPKQVTMKELEYSLGAVRKIVGINLRLLIDKYPMRLSVELSSIMPDT
jgi:hypothetical protein